MTDDIPVVFLDDRLWRKGCACQPACRQLVETLRLATGRYRRLGRVYIATTPSELLDWPPEIVRDRRHSMAVLDLEAYPTMDAVMEAARIRTEKRGRVNRDVNRARRLGYYAKPFVFDQFIPDVVDVHQSKDERQGTPLKGYYHKTVEQLGGAPERPIGFEQASCSEHQWLYWGVFLPRDGHMQGAVRTDEQLVGYIRLRRQGDSASYTAIIGHGEHLANGIMYLLHFEIVAAMLKTPAERRPRYLVYQNYHPRSTLGEWKRRALFDPHYLHYVDERALELPDTGPPPAEQGRRAVKVSLQYPRSAARYVAELFDVSQVWLNFLQRAWVIDRTRGTDSVGAVLEHGPTAIETLQLLRSELLPLETLDTANGVSVALCGADCGADTLLLLRNAGIADVHVYHAEPNTLTALRRCYGPGWTYALWTERTVFPGAHPAAIVEVPKKAEIAAVARLLASFSGSVILSVCEATLNALGFGMERISGLYRKEQPLARELEGALTQAFSRNVQYRSIHYRCADPGDVFWICLRLN